MEEESKFLSHSPQSQYKSREDIILENYIEKEYKKIIASNVRKKSEKGWRRFIGIIFTICAGLCVSLIYILVQLLLSTNSHHYRLSNYHHDRIISSDYTGFDEQNIILWGFTSSFIISTCIWFYFLFFHHKEPPIFQNVCPCSLRQREQRPKCLFLIVNGVSYWASVIFKVASIYYLSISESAALFYIGPLTILMCAHFCLENEKCKVTSTLLALLVFGGAFTFAWPHIIERNEFDKKFLIGIALGLGAMLCHTISTLIIRKYKQIHFSVSLSSLGVCGLSLSLISFTITGSLTTPNGIKDLLMVLGIGICAFGVQFFWILALKYEEAVAVYIVLCCEIIFIYIYQLIFIDRSFELFRVIGGVILLLCILLVGIRRYILTLPREDKLRKICCVSPL